ncbi:hypothetical protein [Methylobacterium sp. J-070]|uniref:hypothetical protein n=1 Tax=Methylobacterium sp. J-070 TaxID=2836650 RepID=UPI001FBBD51F|nr:hypothetical protein [Methylobacterium sp. J-070]MCJ2050884.1 hypothetical protein [Methylobacterium sp. J-070]
MTILALVRLALQLVTALVARANAERERGLGRTEAMAAALTQASESVRVARAVEAQAEAAHRADRTDAAFDPDFRRPD